LPEIHDPRKETGEADADLYGGPYTGRAMGVDDVDDIVLTRALKSLGVGEGGCSRIVVMVQTEAETENG
jgi:hypothetical protein